MRAHCSDTAQGEEKAPGRQRAGLEQPTKVYWPSLQAYTLVCLQPGSERCILFLSFAWETHAEFLLCILLQSIAPEEKTDTKERGKLSLF